MNNDIKKSYRFLIKSKRNISLLWLGQTISQAGDSIYQLALIWLVLELTNSSLYTGLIAMCAYLPAVLFGLFSGVITDRYNRFKIMIFSNLGQAIMVFGIPILIWYDKSYVWLICILAFLRSCFNTFFQPALNSFIPEVFNRDQLPRINAIIATSGQIAWLLGPFFAGALLSMVSLSGLFVLDSISFLLSIVVLLFISRPEIIQLKPNATKWNELKEGLILLKKQNSILSIILITFLNNIFIMGPAIVGIPILVREVLNGDATDFAYIEGCMAAGALLGSIIVSFLKGKIKNGMIWIIGLFLDGITMSFLYWSTSVEIGMLMLFFHGIGIPFIMISRTSIIQTHTLNKYHGRFFSFVHLGVVGTTAISSGLVGIVLSFIAIDTLFLIIGIGGASCALIGIASPTIKYLK